MSLSRPSSTTTVRVGRWCAAAAAVGVLQGAVMLVWPHQVPEERFSFPMTATVYVVVQATFFLQHLPLAAGVGVLATRPELAGHRTTRTSLRVATAGFLLLALMELVAMAAATTTTDSTLGTTIASLYGVPTLLAGGGLLVAGIALWRAVASLGRPVAAAVLVAGAAVFVVLLPALASGSYVGGRLAIMAWMLPFVALGLALTRLHPAAAPEVTAPQPGALHV